MISAIPGTSDELIMIYLNDTPIIKLLWRRCQAFFLFVKKQSAKVFLWLPSVPGLRPAQFHLKLDGTLTFQTQFNCLIRNKTT